MTERNYETGQSEAAFVAAQDQKTEKEITRGSEEWHAWRAGLTDQQQALADQGLMLPGNNYTGFDLAEMHNPDGSSTHIEAYFLPFGEDTLVAPASEKAQKMHGQQNSGPKRRY